jgi:RNA polymerase sigma-70 factor, ECF subfamily
VQESVFVRIARGEDAAVRECMTMYGGLVWSLARRFSESAADAEDAVQDIFLDLWKSAHRFDAAAGTEAAFVSTIARRRLIDRMRSSARRPGTEPLNEEHTEQIEGPGGSEGEIAADFGVARRALEQLDSDQRDLLLMGVVEGMSHSEIALATGKPLGTVKTQMRRGLSRIRRMVEEAEPG